MIPRPMLTSLLGLAALLITVPAAATPVYAGPIIDAHAHIRLSENGAILPDQPQGTAPIRAIDQASGVTRSALIVIATGTPENARALNDAVIAAAASDPEHFYAVASVNPDNGSAALLELERVAALGVRVIKLHPNAQEFDISAEIISQIAARAGELGLTILIDSYDPFDPAQIGKLVRLTASHPRTRFILAHMGYTRFRETMVFAQLRRMGRSDNVWFDLSAISTTYAGTPMQAELVATMRAIGMDRMIFGSDWPVYPPADVIAAIRRMDLTEAEQRMVFYSNIAGLLYRP